MTNIYQNFEVDQKYSRKVCDSQFQQVGKNMKAQTVSKKILRPQNKMPSQMNIRFQTPSQYLSSKQINQSKTRLIINNQRKTQASKAVTKQNSSLVQININRTIPSINNKQTSTNSSKKYQSQTQSLSDNQLQKQSISNNSTLQPKNDKHQLQTQEIPQNSTNNFINYQSISDFSSQQSSINTNSLIISMPNKSQFQLNTEGSKDQQQNFDLFNQQLIDNLYNMIVEGIKQNDLTEIFQRTVSFATLIQQYQRQINNQQQPTYINCITKINDTLIKILNILIDNYTNCQQAAYTKNFIKSITQFVKFKLNVNDNQLINNISAQIRKSSRECLRWIQVYGNEKIQSLLTNCEYLGNLAVIICLAGGSCSEENIEIRDVLIYIRIYFMDLCEGRELFFPYFPTQLNLVMKSQEQIENQGSVEEMDALFVDRGQIMLNDVQKYAYNVMRTNSNFFIHKSNQRPIWYR